MPFIPQEWGSLSIGTNDYEATRSSCLGDSVTHSYLMKVSVPEIIPMPTWPSKSTLLTEQKVHDKADDGRD